MEDRLLFINKRPEIVEEFVKAYESEEFQVEVARSGVEGYRKIQAANYKVVVTGMILPDIDGTKLITYLKKHSPDTICIVYTTKLNVGQLAYLVNELRVFRIYLRPGDYRGEMLDGIQEAFEQYELNVQREEERLVAEETIKEQRIRFEEMRKRVLEQSKADEFMLKVMEPILLQTTNALSGLRDDEKAQLLEIEREIVLAYLKENKISVNSMPALEMKLKHQFYEGNENRSLRFDIESRIVQLPDTFADRLYMCLWVLNYRMNMLTKYYEAHVVIEFETSTKVRVVFSFLLPPDVWETQDEYEISKCITGVFEHVVKDNCTSFKREYANMKLSYEMGFDASEEAVFIG